MYINIGILVNKFRDYLYRRRIILYLLFITFLVSRSWFVLSTIDNFAQLRFIEFSKVVLEPNAVFSSNAYCNYSRILFPYIFKIILLFFGSPLVTYEFLRFILVFVLLLTHYYLASCYLNSSKALLSCNFLSLLVLFCSRSGSSRGDALGDLLDIIIFCLVGIISLRKEIDIKHIIVLCLAQIAMALNKGEASLFLGLLFFILNMSQKSWSKKRAYFSAFIAGLLLMVGFLSIFLARCVNMGASAEGNLLNQQFKVMESYQIHLRTIDDIKFLGDQVIRFFKGIFSPEVVYEKTDKVWVSRYFSIYNIWFSFFWVFIPLLFIPTFFIRRLQRSTKYLIFATWVLLILSLPVTQRDEIRGISFIFPFCAIIPFKTYTKNDC